MIYFKLFATMYKFDINCFDTTKLNQAVPLELFPALTGLWPVCTVLLWLTLGFLLTSAYSLVAITVNRYLSIHYSLRYRDILTHRRAKWSCILLWGFLLTLSLCLYIRGRPGK